MFTGLIADVGEVLAAERGADGARLRVGTELAAELAGGDSIAIAGVCLTVAGGGDGAFTADVMNQTLELTSLGGLGPGDRVNLEPALRASDRLGGHIVQGHVDGRGELLATREDGFARRLAIALPPGLRRYTVERGSIALEGVSLTVAALTDEGVEVSLIPETLARTTLGEVAPGDPLNVEVDVIARYAERLVQPFTEKED